MQPLILGKKDIEYMEKQHKQKINRVGIIRIYACGVSIRPANIEAIDEETGSS